MGEYYKKVDESLFEYGVTIPIKYQKEFLGGIGIRKGKSRKVKLHWGKLEYEVSMNKSNRKNTVIQLRWDSKKELLAKLRKEFIQSYIAIKSLKFEKDNDNSLIKLDGGHQEVLIFRPLDANNIELKPFIRIKTPYDNMFRRLVEEDVFGWLSKINRDYLITKTTQWYDVNDLKNHVDKDFVIYYLIDENKKEIYIGSAIKLGDRVKPKRKEIPGWNKFRYEIVHPSARHLLRRIEFHSINLFAHILSNRGGIKELKMSNFKLVNKNWPK